MRLFVGVWPPSDVLNAVAALPRAGEARWTRRDQWHVTLLFIGEVDDPAPWVARVQDVAASCGARTVTLGRATRRLGRDILVLPASGLDDIAAAFGNDRFRGHLTLARNAPSHLAGDAFEASFEVRDIALIRSHLGNGPARYETIATATLG